MTNKACVLSGKAKTDLQSIARYTIDKFGQQQSLKYASELKETLNLLSQYPERGRPYRVLNEEMILQYRFKAHVIFFHTTAKGIFVVRVLGIKMDHPKHLGK